MRVMAKVRGSTAEMQRGWRGWRESEENGWVVVVVE
jgi:hypothetical protein